MVDLATRAMLGEKLKDMGYGTGLYRNSPYVAVKVPVFSFEKLIGVGYVRKMIEQGKNAAEISRMWQGDVEKFKKQRRKYLLYKE